MGAGRRRVAVTVLVAVDFAAAALAADGLARLSGFVVCGLWFVSKRSALVTYLTHCGQNI